MPKKYLTLWVIVVTARVIARLGDHISIYLVSAGHSHVQLVQCIPNYDFSGHYAVDLALLMVAELDYQIASEA